MAHKLAVLDIDGTIAVKGVVPQSVLDGLAHLQSKGYLTTVATGRAYRRVKEGLGDAFEKVISPDALIIAEHGTKIVHRDGRLVQADYFGPEEVDHFVDFVQLNQDMIHHCRYATPDPEAPLQAWVKNEADMEKVRARLGAYCDVFHCSYEELKERMHRERLTHFLAKVEDFITVENLKLCFTRSKMNVLFLDGFMQFVGSFSDKAKAALYLEQFHEVPVKNMLIAGNGINDVDTLNLDAGHRILVGPDEAALPVLGYLRNQEGITRVASPEAFGEYLQTL